MAYFVPAGVLFADNKTFLEKFLVSSTDAPSFSPVVSLCLSRRARMRKLRVSTTSEASNSMGMFCRLLEVLVRLRKTILA